MKKKLGFLEHPAFLSVARVTCLASLALGLFVGLVFIWSTITDLAIAGLQAITPDASKAVAIVLGVFTTVIGWFATRAISKALARIIRSISDEFTHRADARDHSAVPALAPRSPEDRDLARTYGYLAVQDVLSALPEDAPTDEKIALLEQLDPSQFTILSREQRALHEAEHAVVAHALGQVVVSANIAISGVVGGTVTFRSKKLSPEELLRVRIAISVAPVASALRAGDLDGHSSDLVKATRDAQALSLLLATGTKNTTAEQSVDGIIRSAAALAQDILDVRRDAVEEIKEQLLEHEHLEGREVVRIIQEQTPLSAGR